MVESESLVQYHIYDIPRGKLHFENDSLFSERFFWNRNRI